MFSRDHAGVPWTVLVFGNLGIGCVPGAAAVNHVVDRRIDALWRHPKTALPRAGSHLPPRDFCAVLGAAGAGVV